MRVSQSEFDHNWLIKLSEAASIELSGLSQYTFGDVFEHLKLPVGLCGNELVDKHIIQAFNV